MFAFSTFEVIDRGMSAEVFQPLKTLGLRENLVPGFARIGHIDEDQSIGGTDQSRTHLDNAKQESIHLCIFFEPANAFAADGALLHNLAASCREVRAQLVVEGRQSGTSLPTLAWPAEDRQSKRLHACNATRGFGLRHICAD